MNKDEHWGFRLKRLRLERGLTAAEFSRRSGLSPSYVTKTEKGAGESPRDMTLNKIATAFNLSPTALRNYLFGQPQPVHRETPLELLEKIQSSMPLEIPVYARYPFSPGDPALFQLYISRTDGLSKNLRGYFIKGSSLEPYLRQNEAIVVDHGIPPRNGDELVYTLNAQMQVGIFKKIDDNDYIESRGVTVRFEDALSTGVIIASFLERRQGTLNPISDN